MVELVVSSVFAIGMAIPAPYGCSPMSPPLSWSETPAGTQSIAVLCDDPDAPGGDWVHWVIFNLPADTRKLESGVPKVGQLPNGAVQGLNDYDEAGYNGPCPPPGRPHRYFFKVYALDTKLALTPAARKSDLLQAMKGHILAQGQIHGTFKR